MSHSAENDARVTLRPHRSGDVGWVIKRHGELYGESHGWGMRFEALVARILADFIDGFDPSLERMWIAEKDGERVGSIVLAEESSGVAQLRMLLVEPSARGLGVGRRLVGECVGEARDLGYEKMVLLTSRGLDAARRLYEAEGFRLTREEEQDVWGSTHVAQWWELDL